MVIWPKKNSKMGAAAGSRRKSSPPWEVERGLRAGPSDGARPLPTAPDRSRGLPRAPEGSRGLLDGPRGLPAGLGTQGAERRAACAAAGAAALSRSAPGSSRLRPSPVLCGLSCGFVCQPTGGDRGAHRPCLQGSGAGRGISPGHRPPPPPPGARQPEGAESGPSPRLGTRKPQRSTNRRSASPCDASQSARRQPRAAAPASPPPGGSRLGRPSRPERGPAVGFPAHLWTPAFSRELFSL